MPRKPTWCHQIDALVQELEQFPAPWIDRAQIETLLGVGRRRAQQILRSCATVRVGSSLMVERLHLIARLRELAAHPEIHYERTRRKRVARILERTHQEWVSSPKLLVEAPTAIRHQELTSLPQGVELGPGHLRVSFTHPTECLEKLLALAMAIGNDPELFERLTSSIKQL